MPDEDEDEDDELGQVGDQVGGIANRFGATKTPETTESGETTETTETTSSSNATTEQSAEMSETTGRTETSESSKTTETSEMPAPGDEGFQLREHWNGRTLYLPDDVVDDLDLRYKQCSIKWQQQRGGELPKNERFYPAVVRAALRETSIEVELGLDE